VEHVERGEIERWRGKDRKEPMGRVCGERGENEEWCGERGAAK